MEMHLVSIVTKAMGVQRAKQARSQIPNKKNKNKKKGQFWRGLTVVDGLAHSHYVKGKGVSPMRVARGVVNDFLGWKSMCLNGGSNNIVF